MMQPIHDQKYTCSICLDDISFHVHEMSELPTALGCGHVYHMTCIEEWSKEKFNCPLCREDVKVLKIAGPITFESIRQLERRERPEDPSSVTALRVACAAIYLMMIVKVLGSKSKSPPFPINIKPISYPKI